MLDVQFMAPSMSKTKKQKDFNVLGNLYAQAFDSQAFGIQANIIR